MRVLLLLRGSAGCGKSTWIEKNGLKPYALSADDIRLLCQSPIMEVDGTESISQSNDAVTWKVLFNLLETRMQKGEFTVIDATNSKTSEMNRYKEMCDTYRYRMYCVDFTDIPIEEVKRRNANREPLKRVPDVVIDKMYSRFATQKIPSGIKVIKPDELDTIWMRMIDLSEYKKVHHIGDIHGCNTVLQQYLADNGGMKDDEFYIFVGDYVDRGLENADVIKFLISIKDKKNVLLLEGNHEKWLKLYSHDCTGKLDNDVLPEYKPEQPYTKSFSGKRIKRGLYQSKNGTILNADVNGAYNIMRKGKQNFTYEKLSKGLLESPLRIRLV